LFLLIRETENLIKIAAQLFGRFENISDFALLSLVAAAASSI